MQFLFSSYLPHQLHLFVPATCLLFGGRCRRSANESSCSTGWGFAATEGLEERWVYEVTEWGCDYIQREKDCREKMSTVTQHQAVGFIWLAIHRGQREGGNEWTALQPLLPISWLNHPLPPQAPRHKPPFYSLTSFTLQLVGENKQSYWHKLNHGNHHQWPGAKAAYLMDGSGMVQLSQQ